MHDRAVMQLIIATLSPTAMSCVIGCLSSNDMWISLKDRFSTVTKASIFQLKTELQNIKKGNDSVSTYLQRIKDVRDHLSAAGVIFEDDDIVILALKGLPSEYNTFKTVIRGRENVISLKEFRSQLLAEEATVENNSISESFVTAMVAQNTSGKGKALMLQEGSSSGSSQSQVYTGGSTPSGYSGPSSHYNGGYSFNGFRGRGRGRNNFHSNSKYNTGPSTSSAGILGPAKPHISTCPEHGYEVPTCQICNKRGHIAADCFQRHSSPSAPSSKVQCQICWKYGHIAVQCYHRSNFTYQGRSPPSTLSAMNTTFSPSAPQEQFWVADTGATSHMTSDLSNLNLAAPFSGTDTVTTASGSGLPISHIGSTTLHTPQYAFELKNILHVPQLSQHLLSIYQLCKDNKCRFICDEFCFWIQDKITGRIILQGLCREGLYPIPFHIPQHLLIQAQKHNASFKQQTCYLGSQVKINLWHQRLGHPSNIVTSAMLKQSHIPMSLDHVSSICTSCLEGKFAKLPFLFPANKTVHPLEVIHSDVWGPSSTVSIEGYKFYVSFVDECTRFTWIFPLMNKSEVFDVFVHFHSFLITQFSATVKVFQSDGGGEYSSHKFKQYLLQKGILHQKSCPYTPQQNGLAERKHRHILETAITLLQTASLPHKLWFHACAISVYLINRMACQTLQMSSPFQCLFGTSPSISHLKVFGCACFPLLKQLNSSKLQPKTSQCIFIGYAGQYKGYLCLNPLTNKIYVSRHVLFDETTFPYSSIITSNSASSHISSPSLHVQPQVLPSLVNSHNTVVSPIPLQASECSPSTPPNASECSLSTPLPNSRFVDSPTSLPSPTALPADSTQSLPPDDPDFQPEDLSVVLPVPLVSWHPMQTRSKSGISKKKVFSAKLQSSVQVSEPATFKSAIKIPEWVAAMEDEITALKSQNTWSLVPLPSTKNLVGCKWVYRIKTNPDGSVARYKARLVAKGYSQEEGVDYCETFSPVVKPTTVRLILALAAQFQWSLRQLDVKNAFLHGDLHEEVYMSQPQGFESSVHPSNYVCRLHKSLYGLKQAPRAWNEKFTSFLPGLGFKASLADPSLFVQHTSLGTVVLLLYVDDIILTGSSSQLIDGVIQALAKEFDLKDLGQLHYFLGLQITYQPQGLFVSQTKYIKDLLEKVDLQDSKPCNTPCLPYHRLSKTEGIPYHSPHQYRSIVGALQYLTFTRPDIAFSVNQCCQFMHHPMDSHVVAVKHILRYLSGTLHYGLQFQPGKLQLQAYSDADWAGDPNDRRSTSGHIVYLGSSPISWASKKQHTVSRSSTEAEYRALAIAAAELAWVRQVLCDLCVPLFTAPVLYCDNISGIALSSNPVFHSRVKHIEIDYHFVRERVIRGDLHVLHVSSKEQFADILTKGLSAPLFQHHCSNLMLGSSKHMIEGGCKDKELLDRDKCQKMKG
ncbi:hypothetical protein C1H46_013171 [Malus baccata]|uniref:Integrase catalytic domain-containing protein n=1 Tax=Malus baccata TaxID=106549 RepID=A0A540MR48_MALBA|nr:hypothetical protein C1H46_013171 [Malus baccata]